MKLQTSHLDEAEVRACLDRAKADGLVPADVVFDIFGTTGSRSFRHAYEVHLASADRDSRPDGVKRKTSSMSGGGGLKYAATYDEWGWFLAEFFAADADARSDRYRDKDDFHAKTDYTYADRDDLPDDCPADPEPVRTGPDTEPTSHATIPPAPAQLITGCWTPGHP